MKSPTLPEIRHDVPLADYCTIGLGGNAREFIRCSTTEEILAGLEYAREKNLRVHVLGGGSNTIFSDQGFDGLVINIGNRGVVFHNGHPGTTVIAAAGEDWDAFVQQCIEHGLTGIECLSGIPGLVGATPIQNVGAYGQEVCQTLACVNAIDTQTLASVSFTPAECELGYRQSRFRNQDAGRYIITEVQFALAQGMAPEIRYDELRHYLEHMPGISRSRSQAFAPGTVRDAVLQLRRKKSMVIDPADPNARSVGSFFTNPILSPVDFERLTRRWSETKGHGAIPSYDAEGRKKIPAAWLVEHAGYRRGYRKGHVGVSVNHALALINCGGTSAELLALADEIEQAVVKTFGVRLEREPVVVT